MATVTAAYPFIEVFIDNVEDPEMRKEAQDDRRKNGLRIPSTLGDRARRPEKATASPS
jgi:hypothetical protein